MIGERPADVQQALRDLGWPIGVDDFYGPITRQAVYDFQAMWVPPPGRDVLHANGESWEPTRWALGWALHHNGHVSRFFRFVEFKSKGNGWIKMSRRHIWCMDRYRERFGPTAVISGYRDPAHNRHVGGATRSRHMMGDACDVRPVATVAQVRELNLFTGIGFNANTGRVAHVDTRPGDPRHPTIWKYGR